jgi:hypothetical protein
MFIAAIPIVFSEQDTIRIGQGGGGSAVLSGITLGEYLWPNLSGKDQLKRGRYLPA